MTTDEDKEFVVRFKKPKAWDKIKKEWNENPILVVAIGTGAAHALAKVIDSIAGFSSKRAYAKRVNSKADDK